VSPPILRRSDRTVWTLAVVSARGGVNSCSLAHLCAICASGDCAYIGSLKLFGITSMSRPTNLGRVFTVEQRHREIVF